MNAPALAQGAAASSRCLCPGPRHADGCAADGSVWGPPARPVRDGGPWRMVVPPVSGRPLLPPDGCLWLLDTETTGLPPSDPNAPPSDWPRIVEIAAVPLILTGPDAGRLGQARAALVRPDVPVPSRASEIHGLDDAALERAPSWAEVWPRVCNALPPDAWVAAHNAVFDRAVIRAEVIRTSGALPPRWRWWCTLEMAHWSIPGLTSYALTHLRGALGLGFERAHRAAADARTAARLAAHCHAGRPVEAWAGAWGDGVEGWSAPLAGDVVAIHRSRQGQTAQTAQGDDR